MTLFEVELKGVYHEHWWAESHLDAARRAFSHADEAGVCPDRLDVSSMIEPGEPQVTGGIVFVLNDTRAYKLVKNRCKRVR